MRVGWGLLDTMEIYSPSMALRRVDFPTLGRPTIAINAVFVILQSFRVFVKCLLLVKAENLHDFFLASLHVFIVLLGQFVIVPKKVQS